MSLVREETVRGARARAGLGMALAVALVLGALPAHAQQSARLLPELDPGSAAVAPAPLRWMALELAAGAGAAVVAVPLTLLASRGVGSLSNNLVLAAGPALLLFAVLPPLAVAGAEAWMGNRLSPGWGRLRPSLWVALGVQVLTTVAAISLGASAYSFRDVALLTLAEAVVLPASVTLTAHLSRPSSGGAPPQPPPALEPSPSRDAARPRALTVPLLALSF